MKIGYLDTSVAVAMACDDAGGAFMARAVRSFDRIYSSVFLETEFLSAMATEDGASADGSFLKPVRLIFPDSSLSSFSRRALEAGARDGAAVLHLATALFLFPDPGDVHFISVDENQLKAASALGFQCEFM